MFLVDHRKARRLLPPGGHVEPGEMPWAMVVREADEELQAVAVPHPLGPGGRPLFVTVTQTVGPPRPYGRHVLVPDRVGPRTVNRSRCG
ncbi:NUDIX domain-containing protein [Dactylosporangium sp. CA-139066]|uniref:NUDIX domain-containing protein n=1 Tax=Dactylosporangium sp. CA-139066 TaxID=3239930 RepID=UPI003D8D2695